MSTTLKPMVTAVVELHDEEEQVTAHFARNVSFTETEMSWTDSDLPEEIADKIYPFTAAIDRGEYIEVSLGDDAFAHVRPLDPYDGVRRSRAGVPQPLEVLQAEVLRGGGVVAQELSAVVAPDNTVVTLLLETGMGLYVRFSGDWQLLSSDSSALDDTYLLPVSGSSLEVFDKADMSSSTLSAFDLPRVETLDSGVDIDITPEPVGIPSGIPDVGGVVVASGPMIPRIDTLDDLDLAIRVGMTNPSSRWYIAKRAAALGATGRVPADWLPHAVVRPFSTT